MTTKSPAKFQKEPSTTVGGFASIRHPLSKTPAKFPIYLSTTVGGVASTRYLLSEGWRRKLRNDNVTELRKAEYCVPSRFLKKTSRKYACSNILKILQPKKENFQIKILIFFIFLLKIKIVVLVRTASVVLVRTASARRF